MWAFFLCSNSHDVQEDAKSVVWPDKKESFCMIPRQPEQRQALNANSTLALGLRVICETPHILDPGNRVASAPRQWFGIANIGTLLVRAAEGSEHLGSEFNGGLHLGGITEVREEVAAIQAGEAYDRWPGTSLSPHDEIRLADMGFKEGQEFPLLAFQMLGFRALYMEGRGTAHASKKQDNLRYCVSKYRLPFMSDMDLVSRDYLETLWGVQLHRTEGRMLTPTVHYGNQQTTVTNPAGSRWRTKMLTQPFPLTTPVVRKVLKECRQ